MVKTVVCCLEVENYCGRGKEYVNKLFDMVRRNLPEGYEGEFVCFTDDAKGLAPGIAAQSLPGNLGGWNNKIYLFKDGLFEDDTQVFYFDLDTLICGALEGLFSYRGLFATLRDFYRPDGLGPAIISWRANKLGYIWDSFEAAGYPNIPQGDQGWLEMLGVHADTIQDMFPDQFVSYKAHCQMGLPDKAKVVCFHGEPKNHNAGAAWVDAVWAIGGLTKFDTTVQANIPDSELARNVRHACTLPYPWLKKGQERGMPAIIVGGGPSLRANLKAIRAAARDGAKVFSLNNSYKFLKENRIWPDYQVMLDGRAENAEFVPADAADAKMQMLYGSTCHADVFAKARGSEIIIWHPAIAGIEEILKPFKDRPQILVGGGCNVGLKAMCIAHCLGFKQMALYGFDSSYEGDDGHAYAQKLNEGERVLDITVDSYKFKCAPWMVTQAQEFQELAPQLVALGCEIHVYGNGLLPYLAYKMSVAKAA